MGRLDSSEDLHQAPVIWLSSLTRLQPASGLQGTGWDECGFLWQSPRVSRSWPGHVLTGDEGTKGTRVHAPIHKCLWNLSLHCTYYHTIGQSKAPAEPSIKDMVESSAQNGRRKDPGQVSLFCPPPRKRCSLKSLNTSAKHLLPPALPTLDTDPKCQSPVWWAWGPGKGGYSLLQLLILASTF